MISFNLRNITEPDDWKTVTIGMAPDGVSYDININDKKYSDRSSLTNLVGLYICVKTDQNEIACSQSPYEIESIDSDRVQFEHHLDSSPKKIRLNKRELLDELEPFLKEIFLQLDHQSTNQSRNRGLNYLSSMFDFDARNLYERLTQGEK